MKNTPYNMNINPMQSVAGMLGINMFFFAGFKIMCGLGNYCRRDYMSYFTVPNDIDEE